MRSYEFLIIFSGEYKEADRASGHLRLYTFQLPLVRVFCNEADADDWAERSRDFFMDPSWLWSVRRHNVYELARVSSSAYFQEKILPSFKAALEQDITDLVFSFMHEEYAKHYRGVLKHQLGNRQYATDQDRYQAYANFMRRPFELSREIELQHFREFFSGDILKIIERSLIQYFEAYDGATQLVEDKAAGQRS